MVFTAYGCEVEWYTIAIAAAALFLLCCLIAVFVKVTQCLCKSQRHEYMLASEPSAVLEDHSLLKSPSPNDFDAKVNVMLQKPSPTSTDQPDVSYDEAAVRASLRGTNYELVKALGSLSSQKMRYLVRDLNEQHCLLVITKVDTVRTAYPIHHEVSQANFISLLTSIHHPFLDSAIDVTFSIKSQETYVFHDLCSMESLQVIIQRQGLLHLENPSLPDYLPEERIRRYGRHILEGLKALKQIGMPYPQLSTSSIVVVNDVCKLTDLEDIFTGMHPVYHIEGLIMGIEEFRFGEVLMEMATGRPADESELVLNALRGDGDLALSDQTIAAMLIDSGTEQRCPEELEGLLQAIFAPQSQLTVQDLLLDQFFSIPDGLGSSGGTYPPKLAIKPKFRDMLHEISLTLGTITDDDLLTPVNTSSWARLRF